jgi:hypothetical protein
MSPQGRSEWAHATGQHGIITRQQANAGGVPDAMLRGRNQSGLLKKTGVRTFASALNPPSALAELHALMLDIGDPVWAFGVTAGALLGCDGFVLAPPFHLVIERARNVHRAGHVIHSVKEMPLLDRTHVNGIPCTTATRVIIDLSRHGTREQLVAAIASSMRDLLTTEDFLHRRINDLRSQGRYGIPTLVDVLEGDEVARFGHSWLERRFLELVVQAGVPIPETQVVMTPGKSKRIMRVDCFFREHGLVVEVLGYRWHRTEIQMSADARRANALMLQGLRTMQFTYSMIATQPKTVIADLQQALGMTPAR